MNARLTKARNNESGFTLVELLVVIGIIAILTAIAVPMFLSQRQKANDAAVRSDVKNIVTEVETGAVDATGAVEVTSTTGKGKASVTIATVEVGKVNISDGVTVEASGNTGKTDGDGATVGYKVTGSHTNGKQYNTDAGTELVYNSASGGFTN